MAFVATINVPGYLPMNDEPPTFETAREAWEYLRDEHAMGWNDVDVPGDPDGMLPEPFRSQYQDTDKALADHASPDWLVCDFERVGTVYGPTPGYDGDHDLGLAYSVTEVEVYGACGVGDCLDCRPLYDADNNVIPGTD